MYKQPDLDPAAEVEEHEEAWLEQAEAEAEIEAEWEREMGEGELHAYPISVEANRAAGRR